MLSPLIATPCYTERPCINYFSSIIRLHPVPDIYMPSNCSLGFARMRSVDKFLAGEWTHLFFIDDDIGFAPHDFVRMLTAGLDVVAAAAPYRSDDIHHQGGFTVDKADVGETDKNGFAPAARIGAGFMCIRRRVLEQMKEHYGITKCFALSLGESNDLVEEDYSFCYRWQAIGGIVHIDTQADLSHQGVKTYRKDFQAYLWGETVNISGCGLDPGPTARP